MKIFAVSDLHLSLADHYDPTQSEEPSLYKPMNVFGSKWDNSYRRLTQNWLAKINSNDVVLISGDISWAMTMDEAKYDFEFLNSLPGKKIICRGNHDYWWNGIGKLRSALPASIYPLQHDAIEVGDFAVCATRGWTIPGRNDFKESSDRKIYDRELLRLTMALEAAKQIAKPIIVMMHFPPLYQPAQGSGFWDILQQYPVKYCLYGHLHGNQCSAFEGTVDNICFNNTSMDRVNFSPLLVAECQ